MALLAKQDDVTAAVTFDVVREVKSIQIWNGLESREVFFGPTHPADVLLVLQVELWVVELFPAIKLRCVLFRIAEVELDDERLFTDLITIALFKIPLCLLLVTVENVLASLIEDFAVVVFYLGLMFCASLFLLSLPLQLLLSLVLSS